MTSSMHIGRVQVEEGFLDGLDTNFQPGLNVIIGARGTGKTSLIELIRFALDVDSFTTESESRSEQHALSVLGSGQVTVTLKSNDGSQVTVTRSALDPQPRATGSYDAPLIFSQTEVENLGVHAPGRLRLIDGFAAEMARSHRENEQALIAEIRSLTSQATSIREETSRLQESLNALPEVRSALDALKPAEQAFAKASTDAARMSEDLAKLTTESASIVVSQSRFDRFIAVNKGRANALAVAFNSWGTEEDTTDSEEVLRNAASSAALAKQHLLTAIQTLQGSINATVAAKQEIEQKRVSIEERARALRQQIESISQGAGQTARQAQQHRERIAHLESLGGILEARQKSLAAITTSRARALDALEFQRDQRFQLRKKIADYLNERLGPLIKIDVVRSGQSENYAAAIATALRGSGIKYNELAQSLSGNVSPREILEWAESDDMLAFAEATRLPRDRAARALAAFRSTDLGEIGTLLVEDDVQFYLLDGTDHKPISALSTGQRCTVVLSIVLERRDAVIIIDQPEDHIDNAFIAATLVRAICDRAGQGQLVLSTHNPNIPVLGNASAVIQMGSDGRRGFVMLNAPLLADQTVKAITTIMEGGLQAFERRADFYHQNAQ